MLLDVFQFLICVILCVNMIHTDQSVYCYQREDDIYKMYPLPSLASLEKLEDFVDPSTFFDVQF